MNWLQVALLVIAGWFMFLFGVVGLIVMCQSVAGRVRFARDVRAMHAELALIVLDPSQGRLR